jgi:hypothetical protein
MAIDIAAEYKKLEGESLTFEDVEPKLSTRRDIHAFILLNQLLPEPGRIISAAEHDHIWLDVDLEKLAEIATVDHIRQLEACGVYYDDDLESLYMFA